VKQQLLTQEVLSLFQISVDLTLQENVLIVAKVIHVVFFVASALTIQLEYAESILCFNTGNCMSFHSSVWDEDQPGFLQQQNLSMTDVY
jgi:hypothetical protein